MEVGYRLPCLACLIIQNFVWNFFLSGLPAADSVSDFSGTLIELPDKFEYPFEERHSTENPGLESQGLGQAQFLILKYSIYLYLSGHACLNACVEG